MMKALSFGWPLKLCFVFSLFATVASGASLRPNVIVILADDQGWGDLSLHGNPNLSTPHIDSLARDGARLENFYVCAVCSPTRAEFLTGRYHTRMGVYSTSSGGERFDADEQSIAELFRKAGYATACYGKWHSGMQWPYHPNARGFDDYYGFCSGHWANYFDPMLEHNGRIVKGNGFIVDDLIDHAIEFVSQADEKPFFVYLALNTPHSPMQVPQQYWDRFKDKPIVPDPEPANQKQQDLQHTRAALAMCENIDDNVGRVLDHLQSIGKDRETIVVYFSDNGPNGARFNGGMRGRKGSTNEGGLRSPCLIRYPAKVSGGSVMKQVSGAIDLLPTLAEFAGIDWRASQLADKPIDGLSMADRLSAQDQSRQLESAAAAHQRILFSSWNNRLTARSGRYRMHSNGELYDIENERGEHTDLSSAQPEVAADLTRELNEWQSGFPKHSSAQSLPFPLAHPDAEWTQLPARDAAFSGQIKRSNRFPNCSYLLNWIDRESEITWDVDVLGRGEYEVQLYYACPAADVGATIELTLGESRLTAKIQQAVESPMIGAVHDRVVRQESDVRWWQPMSLGTIKLSPGPQKLRLRASEIPGSQVAEFRLLMFRKIDMTGN